MNSITEIILLHLFGSRLYLTFKAFVFFDFIFTSNYFKFCILSYIDILNVIVKYFFLIL